jgi:hypothetical protein
MNGLQLIDTLTYVNYATNRDAAPDVKVESWKNVYGSRTDAMEAKYQEEKKEALTKNIEWEWVDDYMSGGYPATLWRGLDANGDEWEKVTRDFGQLYEEIESIERA